MRPLTSLHKIMFTLFVVCLLTALEWAREHSQLCRYLFQFAVVVFHAV